MGRVFLDHINGIKLFSCASCDTNLTNKSELISTRFTGATGELKIKNSNVPTFCSRWMLRIIRMQIIEPKGHMKSNAKLTNEL